MYEIKIYVEDKDLGRAKRALVGIAKGVEDRPLTHAVGRNGRVESTAPRGSMLDILIAELKGLRKGTAVSLDQLRQALVAAGGNPSGLYNYASRLVALKVLRKKKGNGNGYEKV